MKTLKLAVSTALAVVSLHAQTFDSSGDSMLKGAYRFRQVAVMNADQNTYDPTEVAASYGVITFDGAGNYSIAGTYVDNASANVSSFGTSGTQQALNLTGTYAIGANGAGYIANPFFTSDSSELLLGALAQGVFVGSDTESYYNSTGSSFENDIFIAIPAGTPPVNLGFTAPYWVGLLDFTAGVSKAEKNAMFKLTPNGSGGFGNISVNGFANNQGGTNLTQTVAGASYNFAGDGNASLNVPLPPGVSATNALFTGAKSMYVSADGKFVLGWTPAGYDIFFGVRSLSVPASSSFAGTYFFAGLEDIPGSGADDYEGSLIANGLGAQTMDQRLDFFALPGEDYVCSGTVQFNLDGTGGVLVPPCPTFQYMFSDSAQAFVGIGFPGDYTLAVGLHGSTLACSGLCINTTAVFNAASYAPLTAPLVPGELITLYVSGLPSVEKNCIGGQPCSTQLGGVQVLMDNMLSPIFSVSGSAGTVSALVPYELSAANQGAVQIQINSGGTLSNTVTLPLGYGLPGFFTYSQNGTGPAIAEHANGALVTSLNPAAPGETIVLVLTGAGTVTPTISDGAVPSTTTLSYADLFSSSVDCTGIDSNPSPPAGPFLCASFNDYTHGVSETVTPTFLGLSPGFAAEYQMNVPVPTGVGPGNVYLELYTPDFNLGFFSFDVNQVQIPVSAAPSGAARPQGGPQTRQPAPAHRRPKQAAPGVQRPNRAAIPIAAPAAK